MISSPFFLTLLRVGGLGLRLISGKKRVVGLSFFFVTISNLIALLLINIVLIFFDKQPISFWALEIDLPSLRGWLETWLCFCINSLYHLVSRIQVSPSIV